MGSYMNSSEIRKAFLDFFAEKKHVIYESSPVVPYDDPTLLFTNAGMNQFKKIFLGEIKTDVKRAASAQKCIRVSGKHNDLEEVGKDGRHHTFFEMLGNWSFGDYYKKEAIEWAWEFLTKWLKINQENLYVTVYKDDKGSFSIWKDIVGIPEQKIYKLGAIEKGDEENFWSMGDTGPCGPCTEIFYDQGANVGCGKSTCSVTCGCDRYLEFWNLVFMEFNRDGSGKLQPLPFTSVDTGMGFERIVAIIQGVTSNYETDIFSGIIAKLDEITDKKFSDNKIPYQILCDHIRALVFALSDGVIPSNEGRGYVIRRILRRAARQARKLGINREFIYKLAGPVIEKMGNYYLDIRKNQKRIEEIIKAEEMKFNRTLDKGLDIVSEIMQEQKQKKSRQIPAEKVFMLHDTYGFPLDLTRVIAEEEGFAIDEKGFYLLMEQQKEKSRVYKKQLDFSSLEQQKWITISSKPSVFIGYDTYCSRSIITTYMLENDTFFGFFDETPFYAESGGQVADKGFIFGFKKDNEKCDAIVEKMNAESYGILAQEMQYKADIVIEIDTVYKTSKGHLHQGIIKEGKDFIDTDCNKNYDFLLCISIPLRFDTMRNHTATHLLHEALFEMLGEHIKQAGSFVGPDYLRFDFTHSNQIDFDHLQLLEKSVNDKIIQNIDVVKHADKTIDDAKKMNAKALFTEKYGDKVRIIQIGSYSTELCGGTHVPTTGFIGIFKIMSESSIAAGVRRIEACTGRKAYELCCHDKHVLNSLTSYAGVKSENMILPYFEKMTEELQTIKKDYDILLKKDRSSKFADTLQHQTSVMSIPLIYGFVKGETVDGLRDYADKFKNEKQGVYILFNEGIDAIQAICTVSKDFAGKVHAGKLLASIVKQAGGSAGGKPDFAQGGAKDIDLLKAVLKESRNIVLK